MNAIAAKIIDMNKNKDHLNAISKEIQIHKSLNHENIIKCYGHTQENNIEYIFLEYACGGELFDRIEPDIGMPNADAFRYFKQLLNGIEYLHSIKISHRDLKPENLLLNEQDVIKISDFGTATIFMAKGKYYQSNTMCGTFPYMAPEVFNQKSPYWPDKADLWSCGVILVALLAGELPWDTPSIECEGYRNWKDQTFQEKGLWSKIDNLCLSLVIKVLNRNVKQRYSIADIRNTKWFKKYSSSANKLSAKQQIISPIANKKRRITSSSQPATKIHKSNETSVDTIDAISQPLKSFSQPAIIEDMVINTQFTQMSQSQTNYVNVYQRLVKRMTRFFTRLSVEETCEHLSSVLEKMDYSVKKNAPNVFTISTHDKRKVPLVFKATVFEMKQDQVLIDFRLSRVNSAS